MFAHEMRWAGASRVNTLDVGRGLAIVCVLYGHALAPWFMGADPFYEQAFLQWKFGASFMMAFFFFLSGAGWREQRSLETTIRQAMALVLIAWVSSVALDLVRFGIGLAGLAAPFGFEPFGFDRVLRNAARMAVYGDAYSMSALWFLAALAVVRVVTAFSFRLGALPTWGVAFLLLGLTLAATEFGWRNFYQIHLIGVAMVCFLAGHALGDAVKVLDRRAWLAFALCVIAGAATALTFDLNLGCRWDASANCGQAWLGGGFGVAMVVGQFGNLFWFTVTMIAGIVFALAFSAVIARWLGLLAERMAVWGRASIDLLIANCVLLQLGSPAIGFFIAPRFPADNPLFFIGLFAAMLAANLLLLALLSRPLRRLRAFATWSAGRLIEHVRAAAALARGRVRVSQEP